ncbi:MAG: response regulator transcription factor [Clostridia bacterium]
MSKILVVEDENHIIKVLKMFLKREGHEVLIAEDGTTAVSMAQEEIPDLIFLDILLPKLNGYLVCQALKEEVATKHIPIVFVSAKAQDEDIQKGYDVGGDGFLVKPFTPEQLRSAIKKHIRGEG